MERAAYSEAISDLVSTRRGAAMFLRNLAADGICGSRTRQHWAAKWTNIGDAHQLRSDLTFKMGPCDQAAEDGLCALTAFEVARRLIDEESPNSQDISAKVEAIARQLVSFRGRKIERLQIACCEPSDFSAYYWSARESDLRTPAVICISKEGETAATLLGRLLPVVIGRGLSILTVSHDHVSHCPHCKSTFMLSCCLDYLSERPDIDARQIGVYGEGLSAATATELAASDRRVTAAVCDAGLWNWVRLLASVEWMTKAADVIDSDVGSTRRSLLLRQLRCPALVVAGGSGIVSVEEAATLKAECMTRHVDLEVIIPQMIRTRSGDIENFVTCDEDVFKWLELKLAHG
ncbi:molybdopterin-guanine dinucleotide biosynthesis protein B [Bradyrhizobium sp. CCGUVB14]|uniref:molybdopterin-guanine dinucleotide biosynthesis protein B n=1 Tax=Bradyrhizobium sp. CCGUVB14 TaxID=2949628 RepID=UPI0020B1B7E4|nr:molybdopterin-guanine dinucleotide biosynthesis protein B [Bradyrhizobium sp. CCGUVB14]MCP3441178.1 molybdopterin-guanine dinucleotide biosynthesis protein B [Bradyrhizobium sp. CCGUVB14]